MLVDGKNNHFVWCVFILQVDMVPLDPGDLAIALSCIERLARSITNAASEDVGLSALETLSGLFPMAAAILHGGE